MKKLILLLVLILLIMLFLNLKKRYDKALRIVGLTEETRHTSNNHASGG